VINQLAAENFPLMIFALRQADVHQAHDRLRYVTWNCSISSSAKILTVPNPTPAQHRDHDPARPGITGRGKGWSCDSASKNDRPDFMWLKGMEIDRLGCASIILGW
jgi:hypothetical protein